MMAGHDSGGGASASFKARRQAVPNFKIKGILTHLHFVDHFLVRGSNVPTATAPEENSFVFFSFKLILPDVSTYVRPKYRKKLRI